MLSLFIIMETVRLKNILDYHWINEIIDLKAKFSAYDKGDNCTMFSVMHEEYNSPVVEICIYGYSQSFFEENDVSDLLTEESECITIAERYHDNGKMYVWGN